MLECSEIFAILLSHLPLECFLIPLIILHILFHIPAHFISHSPKLGREQCRIGRDMEQSKPSHETLWRWSLKHHNYTIHSQNRIIVNLHPTADLLCSYCYLALFCLISVFSHRQWSGSPTCSIHFVWPGQSTLSYTCHTKGTQFHHTYNYETTF